MYPQVFSAAKGVDQAFLIIFGFSVFIMLAITFVALFFMWRYNYKRNPVATEIKGSILLEIIWTALPTIIVMGLFWTGWTSFKAMRTIPDDAMVVQVEGRMWSWLFTYDNGKTSKELVVPINTPVKVALTAKDVIHSFYIPAMRVKWDMVPGMDTAAWFESDTTGEFDIFCAEYCGLKHADMMAVLRVVEQAEYDAWLADSGQADVDQGFALLEEFGCFDCHSMDVSEDAAPTLLNLAGQERTVVLPDGSEKVVTADAAYVKRSVLEPGAELVKDWDDEMPSYADEISAEQLDIMAKYLLLRGKSHPGEGMADEQGCFGCHTTNGDEDVGPTFLGLYGSERKGTGPDGKPVTISADEAYLKTAIVDPAAFIPEGYEDEMPIYDDIDQETLDGLVDYIKSLGGEAGQ
ncbi:cytochrome c oxidase subunit II [Pseudodesulfovibrio sediminis]|uniref:Cytochrome c oxidase subunit 2 n=1 Tax=Pseudodesulfovibrio sediminis TaxID=2810563 RepID=A0ABM7P9F0_9BACT|nr:cytochrome c oxidase subunit II [Pseudodesulfovibrio sediminis]BCS89724.1 cytochrome c oxidase subunit 2 [Pseudodesulfovibrio sediminis]